jgi:hypothetical protein
VYEGFDYTIPGDLVGSGGIGWNTAWGTWPIDSALNGGIGGQGNITAIDVQAETILAPVDYAATRVGGEIVGVVGYPTAWREFAPDNKISLTDTGTVYFSFLFSMDEISAGYNGSFLLLDFVAADRTDLFRVGVGIGLDTAAILFSNSNTLLDTGDTISAGTSYLLVGKLETGVGADTLSVNVYASSETIGSEPVTWEMTASQDLDSYIEIDRIGLLFGGLDNDPVVDHTGYIDELRFGDSFASVISDPTLPVADGVFYSFDTVVINSPADDETPNDLLPDPDTYDLVLPAIQNGATDAIAIGAGRDGGNAFNPNVNGYAVLPSSTVDTQFDGATALTIMGWYKSSSLTPGGRLVDSIISGNNNGFFFRVNDVGTLDARLRLGDGTTGVNADSPSNFFVANDEWQFFAVTWDASDGGTVKFYKGDESASAYVFDDGDVIAHASLGNFGAATTFPQLTLGVQAGSTSNARFTGLMDDIQIYSQALSLAEIRDLQGVQAVAAWSFEEVNIFSPLDDGTPNDLLPDPDDYDLVLPAFKGGAAAAIAYGAGRNGGNAFFPGGTSPNDGYAVLDGSANDTALDYATGMTFMGWYKSSSIASGGRIIDCIVDNNTNGFWLRVNDSALAARLRLGDGGTTVNIDTPSSFFVADDTWRFFAVTWDGTNGGLVSFYNGNESTPASLFHSDANGVTSLSNFGAKTNFPQLTLGAQGSSVSSSRFTGLLDDIKLYGRALSLTEIQALQDTVSLVLPQIAGTVTGGNTEVNFQSVTGITYQLQVSTDLDAWTDVPGQSVVGDGSAKTLSDPAPASGEKSFYRVRIE